ncbi:hypothetical protein DL762_005003 [Monosporascus cannonballus]|uniref:Thioredoxin-like fold domain-containing protein n=1 Tax=Monosporascus cannonballus TaxID=155416 RepID=A0ABY0HAM5_9PEZI|nr:hypothetical protein DL762_005003 [Monosporascus cannonballus]
MSNSYNDDSQSTLLQEWESWKIPSTKEVAPLPRVGSKAPTNPNLLLPADKPTIIVFLRHCGDPFAEKTFRALTALPTQHPGVHFVAVSHASAEATERWVVRVGGNWDVHVVVDYERELYAQWGLGVSGAWHLLNPLSLWRTLQLGRDEGIWNRPVESGTRWQTSGAFAVDPPGPGPEGSVVRWAWVAASADDLPDLRAALKALGVMPARRPPPEEVKTSGFL